MRFLLPPSPSLELAHVRAEPLARMLAAIGIVVDVAPSYAALGDAVLDGRALVAWAPPIVCARIEMAGGMLALRAVRGGSTSYRAGIVCRIDDDPDWSRARAMTAAWVDEDSAAGHLLARSWLATRRIDSIHGFKAARFTGSYVTALEAVADESADVASVFLSGAAARPHSTLDEVEPSLRERLRIVVVTGETHTDGIVLAPGVELAEVRPLLELLVGLGATEAGRRALRAALACDELRPVPLRSPSFPQKHMFAFADAAGSALHKQAPH